VRVRTKMVPATLRNNAGIVGAAVFAAERSGKGKRSDKAKHSGKSKHHKR
jgi:hypothetical protein